MGSGVLAARIVAWTARAVGAGASSGTADPCVCAVCHFEQATLLTQAGGHADAFDCIACHADQRPGRAGRRHRSTLDRRQCHADEVRHPVRAAANPHATRGWLPCHDPHGTTNGWIVRETITGEPHVTCSCLPCHSREGGVER